MLLVAPPGRPARHLRRQVDGIRWRMRGGAPWRDVSVRYGSWQSVYRLFRRLQRQGLWDEVANLLRAVADGRRRPWVDLPGTVGRLDEFTCSPARGRRPTPRRQAGRAADGVVTEPVITHWAVPGAS
ncbi:transposase [Actinomadura sp. KC216]|nr:transposase [Actinomadura sp. KC216]